MTKPKPVNWQLIESNDELYEFVQDLIDKYHGGEEGLEGLNFVLMWKHNVRQDQDGYVPASTITKSSDQARELRPHDVVIGINKDVWSLLDADQRRVVIDCQLERIAVCTDKEGEPKEDDRSRRMYRLRRLEVLDDHTIKRRHGLTMQDVQHFVCQKLNIGNAEEGSYVAEQLSASP
jgi:hypothetical protein